jgi:hypothetical protein
VCAASQPGWKVASFSCDFDTSIGAYNRVLVECSPTQTICKKTDPTLPAELPPYSCTSSGSSCNSGYEDMDPICVGT